MSTQTAERTWQVAPEGQGAFSCSCGRYLTQTESDRFAQVHRFLCPRCNKTLNISKTNLSVLHDSARHFDADSVRSDVWYHSTTSATWMEDLIEGERETAIFLHEGDGPVAPVNIMVHVGTVEAALDRNRDCSSSEEVYIYTVRLRAGVDICVDIKDDDNDDCPGISQDCEADGYSKDVTRYVNRFEAPGSISLLVNRECIEIVDCLRLS